MNNFKKYLILLFALLAARNCEAQQNDSLPKKKYKFLIGITIAPNYSVRKTKNRDSYLDISPIQPISFSPTFKEPPTFGYSLLLNTKITSKRFIFNIGAGIGFYNFKGHMHDENPSAPNSIIEDVFYEYKHTIGGLNTSYDVLLGKNKLWYAGLSFDINHIFQFNKNLQEITSNPHTGNILYNENSNYDFTKQMFVFWGGIEVGRAIKAAKWLQINISANCKYSSKIYANDILTEISGTTTIYDNTAQPHNLITASLNVSFYPILKLK